MELAALMKAIEAAAAARAAGRIEKRQLAIAIAGAVLAFGLTRDEIYAEAGPLAQQQVVNVARRMLAAAAAKPRSAS